MTTVPVPTERIPVTLALPFTIKSVVAPPTTTSPIVVTPDIPVSYTHLTLPTKASV